MTLSDTQPPCAERSWCSTGRAQQQHLGAGRGSWWGLRRHLADSRKDALRWLPQSPFQGRPRRATRRTPCRVSRWAALACAAAATTAHRSRADATAQGGIAAPSDIDGSLDGSAFLQTGVATSAELEEQVPPAGFFGFHGQEGPRTHQIPLFQRPREIEINLEGRLDAKALPFDTVAGLSDDLDIQEEVKEFQKEQKVRHQHRSERRERERERERERKLLLTTQASTTVQVTEEPDSLEMPRMALTDYKSYRQAMVNFGDVQYISYITIGRQTISGILDTGSFELVVFSAVCQSCGQAAKYDATLSSSYTAGKLASGQTYGSGDTTSLEAFDKVAIGPFDEANQTFWEVFDAHMPILHHAAFQSIIGVGPPETPAADAWANARKASDNMTAFFDDGKRAPADARQRLSNKITIAKEMSSKSTMLSTFKVSMFSVCVGAKPGSDGYFIWNDTSVEDEPSLFWQVPVVGKHTWSVQLHNVRLEHLSNSEELKEGLPPPTSSPNAADITLGCYQESCGALVDSGTSLLAVPTAVISRLLMYLENMGANCSKLDLLPELVFELNGMRLSLPPDVYVAEVKGSVPSYLANFVRVRKLRRTTGQCQLVLMESFADSLYGPLWILGVPFFRKYYTTFSVGKTKQERSIFVASASEDCEPASLNTGEPPQPYKRQIDPAKLYVPATVMAAATEEFVHL